MVAIAGEYTMWWPSSNAIKWSSMFSPGCTDKLQIDVSTLLLLPQTHILVGFLEDISRNKTVTFLKQTRKCEKPTAAFSDFMSCFRRYSFHIAHLQESGRICKRWAYPCSLCNYELIAVILQHVYDVNPSCWYPKSKYFTPMIHYYLKCIIVL